MAEDDEDDRFLATEALKEARLSNPLVFVHDGEELMEYLHARCFDDLEGKRRYPAHL